MSQRFQRKNIIACGNCGANYDANGPDPRCPACGGRLEDFEPSEARPPVRGYGRNLEGPDLLRTREPEPETAPIEDFVAAGLVFLAFVVMVAGVMSRSPLMLNIGVAIFAFSAIGFGLVKLYQLATGKRKRQENAFEAPSMLDWLVGRGFWDRWR